MAQENEEWHKGVLYEIRHPGPAFGCPYCTETLRQNEMVARWTNADAHEAAR